MIYVIELYMDNGERLKITDFSEEKQNASDGLDTESDKVFGLRTRLADFYWRNKDFLPKAEGEKTQKLPQIVKRLTNNEKLGDIINWGEVSGVEHNFMP